MIRLKNILLSFCLLFSTAYAQHPEGIDPAAASEKGTSNEVMWNIIFFGVIPLILILIYIIWRKKNKS